MFNPENKQAVFQARAATHREYCIVVSLREESAAITPALTTWPQMRRSEVCNSGDTNAKLLDAICCQVASYSLGEAPGQGPSETSHSGAPGIPYSSCIFQADLYATTAAYVTKNAS